MSYTPAWAKLASEWDLPIFHGYSLSDGFDEDIHILMSQSLEESGPFLGAPPKRITHTTGPDGFQRRKHQPNGGRRIMNAGEYSEAKVKIFQEKYNDYFQALTGKHIDFRITPSSQRYISMLEACRTRDKVIMTLFEERPIIWDLMGGSGSDSIAFLFDLNPQKLVIVETANGGETASTQSHEFDMLKHNIDNFKRQFPSLQSIPHICLKTECKKFIEAAEFERYRDPRVHLVYLDPSWDYDDEDPESKFELTPKKLFKNLERTVWTPMEKAGIKVDCYILKTRWSWPKVASYLEDLSSNYHAVYSIKAQPFRNRVDPEDRNEFGDVKGVYHYIVLVHSDHKEIVAHRSEWYMKLIREGKRVYVDKRTVVKPFKPRYADNLEFPAIYERPNQFTFTVTPPDVRANDPEPAPEFIQDPMAGRGHNAHDSFVPDTAPVSPPASETDPFPEPVPGRKKGSKISPKPGKSTPRPEYSNPYGVLPEENESKLQDISRQPSARPNSHSFFT